MADEKKEAGTIDLTPTWEACSRVFIQSLESGTDEGKRHARPEIIRMAKIADAYIKLQSSIQELMLCEQEHTILKPDTLYRFTPDQQCPKCRKLAGEYFSEKSDDPK